ncbi:C-type lectin domain family 4 member M-like isoform X2 [Triplophysa dalaica]|uniref:C-type lectin domain family 4 member M-like isoform X2 n=1 Tax=Triplophysa dalaica TaxID=1582913 RepID=UPI0024DF9F36|nr:C-type lectin domain family 4 member M-like isoform X2 [Triplophysa dalaica]
MSGSVNDSRDKSSIMDGEEKEERIVDIYITAEAVRDIKHKKQTEESETTTRPPEHTGGWIYYESSLYFFSSEKNNWTESRRYCTQRGADLFIINNIEEQYFVGNTSDSSTQHIWIGLYKVADTWKWVDNSTMTSERWGDKEPNGGNNANCVETSGSFWNDHDCSTNLKWICEKKILI